jgi:signal transduction histidine kinase
MTGVLRPLADGATYRRLLYLVTALPLGALGGAVLIAGWSLVAGLAITPLVVPALVAFRAAVGLLARAEAALAAGLLGSSARPGRWRSGGRGFWGSGRAVLADKAFWRSQAYLGLRFPVGGAMAVTEVVLLGGSLFLVGLPIYYRWLDGGSPPVHVDTLQKALLCVPVGLVGLLVAVWLIGPIAAAWRGLADALLRDEAVPMSQATRRRALAAHATAVAAVVALCIAVWALTSRGSFWPVWPLLALGLPLAIHAWVERVAERPTLRHGWAISIHAGVTASLLLFFVLVWAASGGGSFWPEWPALVFGSLLGVHALIAFARGRDELLTERIEVLETTRAGAVDVQETDLRRIERDLHDGAQARLVALGMNLGMAEQKFANDPEAARELVAEARVGIEVALKELRDLARGIHPPVLTDRGLGAAIDALVDHSALPVDVMVAAGPRPAPAVETAAYFVAAEALTNAAKHANATQVTIRVSRERGRLVLEVGDDGAGGADPVGGGLSGLRRRVEALDGTLTVTSPPGGPTLVRAELPCAS